MPVYHSPSYAPQPDREIVPNVYVRISVYAYVDGVGGKRWQCAYCSACENEIERASGRERVCVRETRSLERWDHGCCCCPTTYIPVGRSRQGGHPPNAVIASTQAQRRLWRRLGSINRPSNTSDMGVLPSHLADPNTPQLSVAPRFCGYPHSWHTQVARTNEPIIHTPQASMARMGRWAAEKNPVFCTKV
ncbi:hypothetical protein BS50DRAFT_31134 [Corynespora cassiicola Philippines]|uniref:Uncharacterized protein n=1 Tax=Corynespora cassiicola Philippines TaxID=1448308 RepID=A0A2T2PBJ3_CORCC|nr:hypothetical protein BS50DRAFT_31134 [Corynespora cassiicola Philippines]